MVKISGDGFDKLRDFLRESFPRENIITIENKREFYENENSFVRIFYLGEASESIFREIEKFAKPAGHGESIFVVENRDESLTELDRLKEPGKVFVFPAEAERLVREINDLLKMNEDKNAAEGNENFNEFEEQEELGEKLRLALRKVEELQLEVQSLKEKIDEEESLNKSLANEIKGKERLLTALEVIEHKYRLLFEFNEDAILFLSLEGGKIKIEDANRTASALLGIPREEILRKRIFELYLNNEEEVRQKLLSVINTDGRREYLTHVTKDGRLVKVEIMAHRLKIGEREFVYLDERNVTKETELNLQIRKLSQIIEQSPIAIMMTDSGGRIEYANKNLASISGLSEQELIGKLPAVFSSEDVENEQIQNLVQTIRGGDIWFGKLKMKNRRGKILTLSTVAFPIANDDGVITNYVGIMQDVSQEEEMIKDLRNAKEEAQKANKLKSEFLARISHEIRTPLNTIINFTQILFEELPESNNRIVRLSKDAIIDASKRIIRTIDLILNISMIESGNIQLRFEEFDLYRECLKPIIRQYSHLAQQKGLNFIQSFETKDFEVEADKDSVYYVFLNLIDNAIKFTEKGYVEVRVFRDEKERLTVQIIDTGKGISEEYLPKIFEPFTQEQMGYSREFEGVGLGMALVKRYCDLNAMEINIISVKNAGTKVTVKF